MPKEADDLENLKYARAEIKQEKFEINKKTGDKYEGNFK